MLNKTLDGRAYAVLANEAFQLVLKNIRFVYRFEKQHSEAFLYSFNNTGMRVQHVCQLTDALVGVDDTNDSLHRAAGMLSPHTHAQYAHPIVVGHNDLKEPGCFPHSD